MPGPSSETLRDLLNLLRVPDDESARGAPEPRHDVGGPYRSERETLAAQLDDERTRLEREQALLNERRALIDAVQRASQPETFPRRFFRTLAFGATLGAATSMATLFVLIAPLLGPESRVTLRPPSEWRASATTSASPPRSPVETARDAMAAPIVLAEPSSPLAPCDRARAVFALPLPIGSGITPITDTVWDVDRRVLVDALRDAPGSLRILRDDRLGARVYGIRRASPAARLGLHNGDQLIALDGVLVGDLLDRTATRHAADRFARELIERSRLELSIVRHGEPMTLTYLLR